MYHAIISIFITCMLATTSWAESFEEKSLLDEVKEIVREDKCLFSFNEKISAPCFSSDIFEIFERGDAIALLDIIKEDLDEEEIPAKYSRFLSVDLSVMILYKNDYIAHVIFRSALMYAIKNNNEEIFEKCLSLIHSEKIKKYIIKSSFEYGATQVVFKYWEQDGHPIEALARYPYFVKWLSESDKIYDLTKSKDYYSFFDTTAKKKKKSRRWKKLSLDEGSLFISYLLKGKIKLNRNVISTLIDKSDFSLFYSLIHEHENYILPHDRLQIFRRTYWNRFKKEGDLERLNLSLETIINTDGESLYDYLLSKKLYFVIYELSPRLFLALKDEKDVVLSDEFVEATCKVVSSMIDPFRFGRTRVQYENKYRVAHDILKNIATDRPEQLKRDCIDEWISLLSFYKLLELPKGKFPLITNPKGDVLKNENMIISPENRYLTILNSKSNKKPIINKLLCLDSTFDVIAELRINEINSVRKEDEMNSILELSTPDIKDDFKFICEYMINLDAYPELKYPFAKGMLVSGSYDWDQFLTVGNLKRGVTLSKFKFKKKVYEFKAKDEELTLLVDGKKTIEFIFHCYDYDNPSGRVTCYGDSDILAAKDLNGDGILDFAVGESSEKYSFNSIFLSQKDGTYKKIRLPMGGC